MYLYTVPSIQRKQLILALPDMPYQSLTRAVRTAEKHGYIEQKSVNRTRRVSITESGKKYITEKAGEELNRGKRRTATKHSEKERLRRFERAETTQIICRAAGIKVSTESGISFWDVIQPQSPNHEAAQSAVSTTEGMFFPSEDIARSIQFNRQAGENVSFAQSRYTGVIISVNGVWFVYNTLDKLMRFVHANENMLVTGVQQLLLKVLQQKKQKDALYAPSSIIFGKSCAMLPKIVTGDKWGRRDRQEYSGYIRTSLMRYENLAAHFRKNYFVPLNTLGVDILDRVVHLTQQELNEMKEEWLRSYGDYTIVRSTGYLEGYEKGEDIKTILFPVLQFEEILFQRKSNFPCRIVCERGTQDGISRVLGKIAIDFLNIADNEPLPFHHYDDMGVRMDGVNPFTGTGYVAPQFRQSPAQSDSPNTSEMDEGETMNQQGMTDT